MLKGTVAAGFPTDLWACARIAQAIEARFGVRYYIDHIGRLMRALGWSPQKPTRRALERDETAIATWVKSEWPRVKKRLAPESLAGFHRRIRVLDGPVGPTWLGAARGKRPLFADAPARIAKSA